MNKCPNPRIKNPVPVVIVGGNRYLGLEGWANEKPNEFGLVIFCSKNGAYPYHYVTHYENVERI